MIIPIIGKITKPKDNEALLAEEEVEVVVGVVVEVVVEVVEVGVVEVELVVEVGVRVI